MSTQFSFIWPKDRTLSGATTLGQSWPERDGSEGILHIPQSSRITEVSPSDCLVSYPGHFLGSGESYLSAEKQLVNSPPAADWATWFEKNLLFFIHRATNVNRMFKTFLNEANMRRWDNLFYLALLASIWALP